MFKTGNNSWFKDRKQYKGISGKVSLLSFFSCPQFPVLSFTVNHWENFLCVHSYSLSLFYTNIGQFCPLILSLNTVPLWFFLIWTYKEFLWWIFWVTASAWLWTWKAGWWIETSPVNNRSYSCKLKDNLLLLH